MIATSPTAAATMISSVARIPVLARAAQLPSHRAGTSSRPWAPLQQCRDCSGLAALANTRRLRLRTFLGRFGGLPGRGRLLGLGGPGGLGFATFGDFLALGGALLRAGSLLRGGLLWRDGRALFRNGGGVGGCCILGGHSRLISFLR